MQVYTNGTTSLCSVMMCTCTSATHVTCPCTPHVPQVLNESVMSVAGGMVGSSSHGEVVVATYSGRVLGLTREPHLQQPLSQEVQAKLEMLR